MIVVALHGRGSDESGMQRFSPVLPEGVRLLAPRGPIELPDGGFTWFDNVGIGRPIEASIQSTRAILEDLIASAAGDETVALLGFSGGCAMAAGLLLADPGRYRGAVLLSGTLPWDAGFPTAAGRLAGTQVFWAIDPTDPVIPRDLVDRSEGWLFTESGAEVTRFDIPGIGHTVSADELAAIGGFLTALTD